MSHEDEPTHDMVDQALRQALQQWENLRDLMTLFGPEWVGGFDFPRMTVLPPEHFLGD
jgi:hypothetical protein